MFCEAFPDLVWLKKQAESRFSNGKAWNDESLQHTGWPTVILNVKAGETYRDNIPGPFSLFSNFSGKSTVSVDGIRTEIPDGCFFLTNSDQRYTLEIEKTKPAETFNIHFGERWAEEAFVSIGIKTETLLDQPDQAKDLSIRFYNKLFAKNDSVNRVLRILKNSKDNGSLRRNELLFQLVVLLLEENQNITEKAHELPVLKSATREEILKRLFKSTDYIYSNYSRALSLDELSKVSCLSKFHYLRLFRQMFHQTPHQFVTSVRIEKAKELLRKEPEVKSVANQLGFDNASSFSRLFRQRVGLYPSQFTSKIVSRKGREDLGKDHQVKIIQGADQRGLV